MEHATLIENFRYLLIGVFVQQSIDHCHHFLGSFPDFPTPLRRRKCECLDGATPKMYLDGHALRFSYGDIFNQETHQPFTVMLRGMWIIPY